MAWGRWYFHLLCGLCCGHLHSANREAFLAASPELPSNLLMEPACYFANYLDGRITDEHSQVHWEDTDSCRSGHSSGSLQFLGALCVFFFLPGKMSTQSGIYNSTFQADALLHAVTKWTAMVGGSQDHTNPAASLEQLVPSVFTRRVARARLGTHSCAAPREKEECAVDRVCHVSLRAGGACQASFLTRHTQRPRHKKVSDDTNSETHTCTKHNTDTSGNSESVRAPRAARRTTRDLFLHKSVL